MNINLMVENVFQIKSGITINFGVSAKIQKKMITENRIIFGILLQELLKIVNIEQVILTIQRLNVIKSQKRQKSFQQKLLQ